MNLRGAMLVATAALALAVLGGCAPAGSSAATPVATSAVDLPPSYLFAPPAISVAAGTSVTWTNNDHFTHSVQFIDGGLPTDPFVMEPSGTADFTLTAPGVFTYQCHLHPQNMRGSVTVTP